MMTVRRRRTGALLVLAAVAVTVAFTSTGDGDEKRHLTAVFPSTTSLYEGAQVKVLGVRVGTVEQIKVRGTEVEVEITYDADVKLPDDVNALVVPPSIVGDRFVQLAPVWNRGEAVLADDAHLDRSRTAVPLELDDVYRGLNDLTGALGPKGANKDGAVSRLIRASSTALDGNGRLVNATIRDLSSALTTLAAGQGDIQSTVTNADKLAGTLAGNDEQVAALVRNLALVSTQLNGQRDDIATASKDLARALKTVGRFTRAHRQDLTTTISGLQDVTTVLAGRQAELAEIIDLAPVGLVNLLNIYEPVNWDPTHPELTAPDGRTGSASLRAALFNDLDVQLAHTLGALCASLPTGQAAQLAGLCQALNSAGGDIGSLLMSILERGTTPVAAGPGSNSLAGLLGGAR